MPDCDHNACQNNVWKLLIEFQLSVQNIGNAPAWIANANFESSGILDKLIYKKTGAIVSSRVNWESVPNPLNIGAADLLAGKIYVDESVNVVKLLDTYSMCFEITDRPTDPQQNWVLEESNTINNKSCFDFVMNVGKHNLPNPAVTRMNTLQLVQRNADGSADLRVSATITNKTPWVYVDHFIYIFQIENNGAQQSFCRGAIMPGLHALEATVVSCNIHLEANTAAPGVYNVGALIDINNDIIETSEIDNQLFVPVQIL